MKRKFKKDNNNGPISNMNSTKLKVKSTLYLTSYKPRILPLLNYQIKQHFWNKKSPDWMKKSLTKIMKSTESVNKCLYKKCNTPIKPVNKCKIFQINCTLLKDNFNPQNTQCKIYKVKIEDSKLNFKAVGSNSLNSQLLCTFTLNKTCLYWDKITTINTGKLWNFNFNLIRETLKSIFYTKNLKNYNIYFTNCKKKIITINSILKNKSISLLNMKDNSDPKSNSFNQTAALLKKWQLPVHRNKTLKNLNLVLNCTLNKLTDSKRSFKN